MAGYSRRSCSFWSSPQLQFLVCCTAQLLVAAFMQSVIPPKERVTPELTSHGNCFSFTLLSGLAASLSAIIYVAHLGQAKSDAGTGFELMAITAVVLGGTSIFGGRGTVLGTVLGLFAIVVLQNGLRLSGQPAELAGILTGVLLLVTIVLNRACFQKAAFFGHLGVADS